jgi:hypothetical protein
MTESTDTVVADTRRWLERAVIGLNLCPFAKSVHVKGQVHYAVSAATGGASLREDLLRELRDLAAIDPEARAGPEGASGARSRTWSSRGRRISRASRSSRSRRRGR